MDVLKQEFPQAVRRNFRTNVRPRQIPDTVEAVQEPIAMMSLTDTMQVSGQQPISIATNHQYDKDGTFSFNRACSYPFSRFITAFNVALIS
jgi:hypothetical protein